MRLLSHRRQSGGYLGPIRRHDAQAEAAGEYDGERHVAHGIAARAVLLQLADYKIHGKDKGDVSHRHRANHPLQRGPIVQPRPGKQRQQRQVQPKYSIPLPGRRRLDQPQHQADINELRRAPVPAIRWNREPNRLRSALPT
jgi:hypothetical protein